MIFGLGQGLGFWLLAGFGLGTRYIGILLNSSIGAWLIVVLTSTRIIKSDVRGHRTDTHRWYDSGSLFSCLDQGSGVKFQEKICGHLYSLHSPPDTRNTSVTTWLLCVSSCPLHFGPGLTKNG